VVFWADWRSGTRPQASQAGGQEGGDALEALLGSELVGRVLRLHGTSPVELPQRPSLATGTLAGGINGTYLLFTRSSIEMTKIVKRFSLSS
jgi:hypothetical protein